MIVVLVVRNSMNAVGELGLTSLNLPGVISPSQDGVIPNPDIHMQCS